MANKIRTAKVTMVMVDVQCPVCDEFFANDDNGALNFTLSDNDGYRIGRLVECRTPGCETTVRFPKLKSRYL